VLFTMVDNVENEASSNSFVGNSANVNDGVFAEQPVVIADLQGVLPDNLSFEDGATLGVGITTIGQALYQSLKLPLPSDGKKDVGTILIYGGSTATGSLAVSNELLGC
jgi:NADPH:quinone reductase-like Zn-dependent oxidoreductase